MAITSIRTEGDLIRLRVPNDQKRIDLRIEGTRGLLCRATTSSKLLVSKLADPESGKMRTVSLGRYPEEISYERARAVHSALREQIRVLKARAKAGSDIRGQLDRYINAKVKGIEEPEPRSQSATYSSLIDSFLETHTYGLTRGDVVFGIFKSYISPRLTLPAPGEMESQLSSFTTKDLGGVILDIKAKHGPDPARKSLSYLKKFFSWAKATGEIENDPATSLTRQHFGIQRPKTAPDERKFLMPAEVAKLFEVLDARPRMDLRTKLGIRLLLLCGCRVDEMMRAEWKHVHFERGIWRLPASNTKTKTELLIPLSRQAATLLRRLHNVTGEETIEFDIDGQVYKKQFLMGGMATFDPRKPSKVLSKALGRLQPPEQEKRSKPLSGYPLPFEHRITIHMLRHTFTTFLQQLGVPFEIRELMVNHKLPGTIASIYTHGDLFERRAEAGQLLADALDDPIARIPAPEVFE